MSEKAEEEGGEERSGAGGFYAIYITLGVLVFYVLSPVPVTWVVTHSGLNRNDQVSAVFAIIYAPLDWAYYNIPAANAFYGWQLRFLGLI